MVDIVTDPERGLLQDGRTAPEFLEDLFEYEYCAECGGDAEDHIVVFDPLERWRDRGIPNYAGKPRRHLSAASKPPN